MRIYCRVTGETPIPLGAFDTSLLIPRMRPVCISAVSANHATLEEGLSMDSSNQPLSATEIMERLRTLPASQYPAEAFASAQAVSKALIPLLIEEIRTVTQSLKEGNEKQSEAILPALALLTDFRAKEAWPVILESVQLSDELIDELYGDAVYDALPSFVDRCASQDLHEIEPLISDVKVPESVRTAFLRAI